MAIKILRALAAGAAPLLLALPGGATQDADADAHALVARGLESFKGDLSELRQRGFVRVLTTYDRTSFFVDEGRERGFEVELMRAWAKELNAGRGKDDLELQLVFVPVVFEELIPALLAGHGDLVAAGTTITPARARRVAFTEPYLTGVKEVIVSAPGVTGLTRLADLSGRKVHVTAKSSGVEHLRALSKRLEAQGGAPIEVVEAPAVLETEDLLELVDAGLIELAGCDDYIAKLWSAVFHRLEVRDELAISDDRSIAWAVRPENPALHTSLSAFAARNPKGTKLGNILFQRYFEDARWIRSPASPQAQERLDGLIDLFQASAKRHGFDWIQLAAQAYQESGLDPRAKSGAGAVGLMQLTAATAKEMGCTDRTDPARNIEAGAKYMAWLRDKIFDDPKLAPGPRYDFCLAGYNAGLGRVRKWRAAAPARGLDPNLWFGNVEHIALESVGREPVRYVGNVNKYYFAYRMSWNLLVRRSEAFDALDDKSPR